MVSEQTKTVTHRKPEISAGALTQHNKTMLNTSSGAKYIKTLINNHLAVKEVIRYEDYHFVTQIAMTAHCLRPD